MGRALVSAAATAEKYQLGTLREKDSTLAHSKRAWSILARLQELEAAAHIECIIRGMHALLSSSPLSLQALEGWEGSSQGMEPPTVGGAQPRNGATHSGRAQWAGPARE